MLVLGKRSSLVAAAFLLVTPTGTATTTATTAIYSPNIATPLYIRPVIIPKIPDVVPDVPDPVFPNTGPHEPDPFSPDEPGVSPGNHHSISGDPEPVDPATNTGASLAGSPTVTISTVDVIKSIIGGVTEFIPTPTDDGGGADSTDDGGDSLPQQTITSICLTPSGTTTLVGLCTQNSNTSYTVGTLTRATVPSNFVSGGHLDGKGGLWVACMIGFMHSVLLAT